MDTKFKLWIDCLDGSDPNCIAKQITNMCWYSAAFEVVNEARRIAPKNTDGEIELNGLVSNLIDQGFVALQLSAIRRFTDPSPLQGEKGVFSLKSLLQDMKKSHTLLTRKAMFELQGLQYGDGVGQMMESIEIHVAQGKTDLGIPKGSQCFACTALHNLCDVLMKIAPESRSPADVIPSNIFDVLTETLTVACEAIKIYVDKFVAHAATQESRITAKAITFGDLRKAELTICKIANFLSVGLLTGKHLGFVASPQFDYLRYMESPLVAAEQLPALDKKWNAIQLEFNAIYGQPVDTILQP